MILLNLTPTHATLTWETRRGVSMGVTVLRDDPRVSRWARLALVTHNPEALAPLRKDWL